MSTPAEGTRIERKRSLPPPDSVIEVLSDEDTENPVEVHTTAYHNDHNDDIQITGSNTLPQPDDSITEISPSLRRSDSPINRNVRRRLDDDIEIIDERPAERELTHFPPETSVYNEINAFREHLLRRIETPLGIFNSTEEVPRESRQPTPETDVSFSRRNAQGFNNNRRGRATGRGRARTRRARHIDFSNWEQFQLPQLFVEQLSNRLSLPGGFPFFSETYNEAEYEDYIEGSIMDRIERDNDLALDRRLESEKIYNKKALNDKESVSKHELKGYTNDIKPDDNVICEICGVTLGQGIPEDFTPQHKYRAAFADYSKLHKVPAPWFCIPQCLESDRDLSKRVFAAKCGHVFCGRCIKNIINRPAGRKGTSQVVSIDNPLITAPRKCPAEDCKKSFVRGGAKSFRELYL